MLWLIAFSATASAQCPDRDALLSTLEQQVIEGRFEESIAAGEALVAAFGCGELASPEQIARMWLASAVRETSLGDSAAQETFAAAARLSADTWNEMYGPSLRAAWEAAARAPSPEPGQLRIEPDLGYLTAVDGRALDLPATLPSGPHLLQLGAAPDDMRIAFRVDLTPTLERAFDPKLPPLPRAPEIVAPEIVAPEPVPEHPIAQKSADHRRGRRVIHALVTGGASGLLYSASVVTHSAFYDTPAQQRTEGLRALNDGLVLGSAGIGAVSAFLFVRGLATTPASIGAP